MAELTLQNQTQKPYESIGIKQVIGYNTDFKNNIFLKNPKDQSIIYPAANLIVFNNNENKTQTFQHCHTGTNGITAMAQSKDRRYLAWSEQVKGAQAIIVVIDLKNEYAKKKVFSTKECKSDHYIYLNFCPPTEGESKIKYMVALSGGPDQQLLHFAIDKPRFLGAANLTKQSMENQKFTHCFYHPKEEDFVVVLGYGQIKPYKVFLDNQQPRGVSTQPIKKDTKDTQHSPNYQAYCILQDGTMIIGTDQGELLVFNQNCELKMILPESPKAEQFNIEVIIPYSKGFLVGGQDCTVLIYEKIDGEHKRPYTRIDKKIQCKEYRNSVNSLLLADEKESNLIIGLDNNQMLYVPFNSERVISEDNLKFEHQILPFHSNKITGMDICIRKTLVGTCSLDKTVRIWNYLEHSLENMKEFEEEAHAIAFHPSGFHIIVAFKLKIKIMNLFEHSIVPFKEITAQNCQEIVFSDGGNLFALNNQSMVQIYNFYTGDQANNLCNSILRGAGKVRSIFIEDDDLSVYTGNTEGNVKFWRLDEPGHQPLDVLKQKDFEVQCVTAIADYKQQGEYRRTVYIAGIHKNETEDVNKCIYEVRIMLKLDREGGLGQTKKYHEVVKEITSIYTEANISKVCLLNSGKLFFFGTSEEDKPGAVRAAPYRFEEGNDMQEIQSHKSAVTRLKASFDDNYLFSTSSDSTLIIYDIKDKDAKIRLDKDNIGFQFSEEFLIPQEVYNEQKREIEQLQNQRTEKERKQKKLQQELYKNMQSKIRDLKDQFEQVDSEEKTKMHSLEQDKLDMEINQERKQKNLKESHETQKKVIESEYKKKISMEETRNQDLAEEVKREKVRFDTEEREIKERHERDMEEKRRMFQAKKEEYETQIKQLHKQAEQLDADYLQRLQEKEAESEQIIEATKEANEEKMKELFRALDTNDAEKKTKSSQYESEASKLEEERSKLKEILEQINTLTEQNKSNQKIKEGHIKEIQEREKTIKDKQRRIYELKKKTQELEKFKFVLDYKIKELKREIGPKEEEIAKMKEQIANMRSEIVHFRRNNANLSLIVTDLRLRQKGMRKEIENLTEVEKQNAVYINNYKQDVNDCYSEINDYKKLKKEALKLYNKYVQEDTRKIFEGSNKQKDFIKERAHLETSVNGLKQKFTKNLNVHEGDNARIMGQNVDLIREINDLKRERKNLRDEKKREQLQKNKQQSQHQEAQKLDKQIELLTAERDTLQDEKDQLINENEQLKNQLEKFDQQQGMYQEQQQQYLEQVQGEDMQQYNQDEQQYIQQQEQQGQEYYDEQQQQQQQQLEGEQQFNEGDQQQQQYQEEREQPNEQQLQEEEGQDQNDKQNEQEYLQQEEEGEQQQPEGQDQDQQPEQQGEEQQPEGELQQQEEQGDEQ